MVLNIKGKDYTFEFTIEASLYNKCTESIAGLFADLSIAQEEQDIKKTISSLGNLPQTTLTMFYAGLMEYHSDEITSIDDAKNLLRDYFKEHKEDGKGNFYEVMQLMLEQMENDGFFEQIGLTQMLTEENQVKEVKKPQDHKKKTTTKKTQTEVGEK